MTKIASFTALVIVLASSRSRPQRIGTLREPELSRCSRIRMASTVIAAVLLSIVAQGGVPARAQSSNGPSIEFVSPIDGDVISGTFAVVAVNTNLDSLPVDGLLEFSSDGISFFLIRRGLGSVPFKILGPNIMGGLWQTSSLAPGSYFVRATMIDTDGIVGSATIEVAVTESPTNGSSKCEVTNLDVGVFPDQDGRPSNSLVFMPGGGAFTLGPRNDIPGNLPADGPNGPFTFTIAFDVRADLTADSDPAVCHEFQIVKGTFRFGDPVPGDPNDPGGIQHVGGHFLPARRMASIETWKFGAVGECRLIPEDPHFCEDDYKMPHEQRTAAGKSFIKQHLAANPRIVWFDSPGFPTAFIAPTGLTKAFLRGGNDPIPIPGDPAGRNYETGTWFHFKFQAFVVGTVNARRCEWEVKGRVTFNPTNNDISVIVPPQILPGTKRCEEFSAPPAGPHYKGYRISGHDPNVMVRLETQFGVEDPVMVRQAEFLLAPAIKGEFNAAMGMVEGHGGLGHPHLKCYRIEGDVPAVQVRLETQFGVETRVDVDHGRLLCVPAIKRVGAPPGNPPPPLPTPPPTVPTEPHYKAYEILGHDPNATVDLQTQFGIELGVDVGQARFLLAPALKNNQGDLKEVHLKCYTIAGDDPPHLVGLLTQFGDEPNLDVGRAELLCVPARKSIPPPPKADQLRSVGPSPNRIPVGATGTITATVQIKRRGVPDAQVVFTRLRGNFRFTSGAVSIDGDKAAVTTGANGSATMTIIPEAAGPLLIKITVPGTSLSAFSYSLGL